MLTLQMLTSALQMLTSALQMSAALQMLTYILIYSTHTNVPFIISFNLEAMQPNQKQLQERQAALFLLKAKEVHKISQTALDSMISEYSLLIQHTVKQLQSNVLTALQKNRIELNKINGLNDAFTDVTSIDPFHHLKSEYMQNKYYKDNLGLTV